MGSKKNTLHDSKLVTLDERWELSYWTTALGCSAEELRAAIDAVGNNLGKVRVELMKQAAANKPAT